MLNILYNPKTSIFQRIETLIRTQGELPEDFEPEEREYTENEIRFASGAKEGIFGHHTSENSGESVFAETLKAYLELDEVEALKKFEAEQAADFDIASERTPLLREIIQHAEEYHAGKVAAMGYCFAKNGTKCETVKLGLSLMTLFNFSENEKVCYLLKNIGYCEEFTDYVIMNVSDWEELKKQELYFELAKKLKGWGKISIVEEMAANTAEKREWILCHGCRNAILKSYLAYICAQKCGLEERLKRGGLTEEQMRGATDIMEGLMDEGPCKGISRIEDQAELFLNYLEELDKHEIDVDYAVFLHDIVDHCLLNDMERSSWVVERAIRILENVDTEYLLSVEIAFNTKACLRLGRKTNIDLSEQLLQLMEQDFEKYYTYSYYLLERGKPADEFFALCDSKIDASKYPKGMGDSLGIGKLGEGVLMLDMIVQYMNKYPLQGKKLLEICMQSPITRWRNMAARALRGWKLKCKQTLAEMDKDLYELVKAVEKIECNSDTKEQWNQLL